MNNKIRHISFLFHGERRISKPNSRGLFPLKIPGSHRSATSTKYFTAMSFVEHPLVKNADPVLTLGNGDKLRVYVGGAGDWPVIEAQGVMDAHDEAFSGTRLVRKKPEKDLQKDLNPSDYADLDLFKDWNDW
jgi:hypothetical protein